MKDAVHYLHKGFQAIRDREDIDDTESIETRIEKVKDMLRENEEESEIEQLEILAGLKNIYTETNQK